MNIFDQAPCLISQNFYHKIPPSFLQCLIANSQFNVLLSYLGSKTKLDPHALTDSTSIRSRSYAFDFLSTIVGFNCNHSNDSCDNQILRRHGNPEVIALGSHLQSLGHELRLK